jgi:hypothetical protein
MESVVPTMSVIYEPVEKSKYTFSIPPKLVPTWLSSALSLARVLLVHGLLRLAHGLTNSLSVVQKKHLLEKSPDARLCRR